ncbi:hypothetical protein [Streptomyces maoxianensis]|uniref:hypothetical protein n=1 Tax=Streptomyces maoxianensis TaxID=1459942 RepID=UPI0036D43EF1
MFFMDDGDIRTAAESAAALDFGLRTAANLCALMRREIGITLSECWHRFGS